MNNLGLDLSTTSAIIENKKLHNVKFFDISSVIINGLINLLFSKLGIRYFNDNIENLHNTIEYLSL